MDTSSLKSKNFIIFGLIILLTAGGFLALKPKWQAFSSSKVKLNGLVAEETRLNEIKTKFQTFLKGYKDHEQDANRANQALPLKESDLPNVLANIEQLSQASGLSLGEIGFESSGTGESKEKQPAEYSIQVVPLVIIATGSFASLQNFLTKVENYLRLMDVLSIDMQAEDSASITYQIRLRVYYQN